MKVKKIHLYTALGVVVVFSIMVYLSQLNTATYPDIVSPRPILGNPDAEVKVVEFSDYQCPACRATSSHPQRLINEFGSLISVEFKHFPLSFHQYAFTAAIAVECANDQEMFWEYSETLFINQQNLAKKDLKRYAEQLGLNTESFNACLDSEAKQGVVEEFIREGYSVNIPGTPTFIINGKQLTTTSYDDIKAEIELELNK